MIPKSPRSFSNLKIIERHHSSLLSIQDFGGEIISSRRDAGREVTTFLWVSLSKKLVFDMPLQWIIWSGKRNRCEITNQENRPCCGRGQHNVKYCSQIKEDDVDTSCKKVSRAAVWKYSKSVKLKNTFINNLEGHIYDEFEQNWGEERDLEMWWNTKNDIFTYLKFTIVIKRKMIYFWMYLGIINIKYYK